MLSKPKNMRARTLLSIVFLIIASLSFFVSNFRMFVISSITSFTSISRAILFKVDSLSSQEEMESLKDQIAVLVQENRYLENQLGLRPIEKVRVPVRLLVEKSLVYNTVYIDVGAAHVLVGSYIYAQNNVVVGTVQEVSGNKAKVSFLGSNEKFLAEIVSTGEIIELTGNGIGYYKGNVPKSTNITVGDTIAMKGYPQSIVGTITSLEEDGTSVSVIWVRSPINLSKSKIFYVDQN